MRLIKGSQRQNEKAIEMTQHFTGPARQHPLHETPELTRTSFVHFEPGVRNHWHSHAGGQVLHIVEGEAEVQSEGGPVETLTPGDTAVAMPGEKHWHGAGKSPMTHLAITSGEVTWYDGRD